MHQGTFVAFILAFASLSTMSLSGRADASLGADSDERGSGGAAAPAGQLVFVCPTSLMVLDGFDAGDPLADLCASDDVRAKYVGDVNQGNGGVELELSATVPEANPASFSFLIEAQADTGGLLRTMSLFNYNANNFEVVDVRLESVDVDSTIEIVPTGDLSRFVQPGLLTVRSRVRWELTAVAGPDPWDVFVDQAGWRVPGIPGACCFDDGVCDVLTMELCNSAGGEYQGSSVTCVQANCPQPMGACCFDDGDCNDFTADACGSAGGVYQGDMTMCASADCPQPPGACCFADGSCQEFTEEACAAAGGDSFQGDMTMCASADCPQPPGACCFADGSCQEFTEEACAAAGGDSFQGDMTMCASANCPQPPGACCFADGSCQEFTEEACAAAGGDSFQGDMTMCASADCPQPPGACCFADGSCQEFTEEACAAAGGDSFLGDMTMCASANCPQPPGACCFDDGTCAEVVEEACLEIGGTFQGDRTECVKTDCPVFLESVDVAIRDAATGDRVFVRGFRDGTVEHKFFTAAGGYTPWTVVPDPGAGLGFGRRLEAVEAIALDPNALIYIRAFDDGAFEQNIYTRANGWTGWFAVPHPPSEHKGEPCEELGPNGADVVESVDIEPFDGLPGARMFVRAWRSGLIEQCVYTPADGYTPWSEIPPMGDLVDIVEGIGEETVESVQVTAEGGLFDRRLFIIGMKESRRVYQNIYDPMSGYTGWVRVRNSATEAGLPNENPLVSADVQHLGDGAVLYLRGRANGRVDQNIYTPADGFSGFNRLTRVDNPNDRVMESCCVELIDPGLFGHRIYLRCFRDGTVQQAFYDPADGQSRFVPLPGN